MAQTFKLMCVVAHPDDEALGFGGTLAKYAHEGIAAHLVTATRGERGRVGETRGRLPLEEVGRIREAELRAAAHVLGLRSVSFLDCTDGELAQTNHEHVVAKIVAHIRRVQPHVVLTFGPEGGYGHPDHIAISQFTTAAIVCAADAHFQTVNALPSHRVAKLYYMAWSRDHWTAFQAALKELKVHVSGVERGAAPWPDWAITTRLDVAKYYETVWRAISCHVSQMSVYRNLENLPHAQQVRLRGSQEFYRAFSVVNGGHHIETDIFEGLR